MWSPKAGREAHKAIWQPITEQPNNQRYGSVATTKTTRTTGYSTKSRSKKMDSWVSWVDGYNHDASILAWINLLFSCFYRPNAFLVRPNSILVVHAWLWPFVFSGHSLWGISCKRSFSSIISTRAFSKDIWRVRVNEARFISVTFVFANNILTAEPHNSSIDLFIFFWCFHYCHIIHESPSLIVNVFVPIWSLRGSIYNKRSSLVERNCFGWTLLYFTAQ